jgi:hypothetical protein
LRENGGVCTSRKIQQVMDTEPRRPEAASRAVRGIDSYPMVKWEMLSNEECCGLVGGLK